MPVKNSKTLEKLDQIQKKIDAVEQSNREFLTAANESKTDLVEKLGQLQEKVDAIDRSNKKFLMTATMSKMDLLEKEVVDIKKTVIDILDESDCLLSAVTLVQEESLKSGIEAYHRKIYQLVESFGIEKIVTRVGDLYNSREQECVKFVQQADCEDNIITEIIKCGYFDKTHGSILRQPQVVINKLD